MTSRSRAIASRGHRDDNEAAIMRALQAAGCLVVHVEGDGVPDLVVWAPQFAMPLPGAPLHGFGRIVLLEVKNTKRWKADGKLRPEQQAFHDKWTTAGAPVFKVTTVEEALRAVGAA